MNKQIVFYYSMLNIGGAERSLIRLMNALQADGNRVTFIGKFGGGAAENTLNPEIKTIYLSKSNAHLNEFGWSNVLARIRVMFERIYNLIRLGFSGRHFDLAVLGSHGMSPIIVKRILHSDKCIKCIRSDLKKCNGQDRAVHILNKYRDFIDGYLCVSQTAKESFDYVCPEEKDKSFVLYNLLDIANMQHMLSLAENPFPIDGRFHIASVCRVSDVSKGIFRMLDVCERLVQEGFDLTWYLVGDGDDLEELKSRIAEKHMEDRLITVGRLSNPFGYYKYSDLVAVLSYYEGLSGTVNEAKVSGAAVIATEFSGIHEQIISSENGLIVANDEESIMNGMRKLLNDETLLKRITNNIYPDEIINDRVKLVRLYESLCWFERLD